MTNTTAATKTDVVALDGANNPHIYKQDGSHFIQDSSGHVFEMPERGYNALSGTNLKTEVHKATLTVNVNVDADGDNGWIVDEGQGLAAAIADLLDGAGVISGEVTVNI